MTQFLAIMPVLKVADLRRSIDWYTGVLGFHAGERRTGDGDEEYCFIQAGGIEILLSTGSHLGGTPAFTGTLYIRVIGVDALYARMDGRADIVWPLELQEYGTREFGIRDPDGYVLAFAELSSAAP